MAERLGRGLQIRLQRFNSASHLHFFHSKFIKMIFWGLILGLPLLAFGGVVLLSLESAKRFSNWFENNKIVASVLTVAAWFWTAYECHIIGIAAFDNLLKIFPFQLWIMAAVLSYLTIIWMPKNLSVRALTGLMMLMPASLFRTSHAYRPPAGTIFAPVDVFVYVAYIIVIIGMYGMFYPWRAEKFLSFLLAKNTRAYVFGGLLALLGLSLIVIGFSL